MAKKETKLDFFKRIYILQDLSNEQIKKFISISKPVRKKSGDVIMKEGEPGDTMYFFKEGTVEVSNTLTLKLGRRGFEETEKSLVKLSAEHMSFFGDMSIIDNSPRSATITAITDCYLYEIHKKDFDRLCENDKDLGYKVMKRLAEKLSQRVRKGNQDILKLTTALSIALSK